MKYLVVLSGILLVDVIWLNEYFSTKSHPVAVSKNVDIAKPGII